MNGSRPRIELEAVDEILAKLPLLWIHPVLRGLAVGSDHRVDLGVRQPQLSFQPFKHRDQRRGSQETLGHANSDVVRIEIISSAMATTSLAATLLHLLRLAA